MFFLHSWYWKLYSRSYTIAQIFKIIYHIGHCCFTKTRINSRYLYCLQCTCVTRLIYHMSVKLINWDWVNTLFIYKLYWFLQCLFQNRYILLFWITTLIKQISERICSYVKTRWKTTTIEIFLEFSKTFQLLICRIIL